MDCLVGAVLARVPAGPRPAPAQPRRHESRRRVHARPAAGGAAPTAAAAAARAPALPRSPRRQEAAEPVPLHGGRSGSPARRSAPLGRGVRPSKSRSARLRSARLGPAPLASPQPLLRGAGPSSLVSAVRLRSAQGRGEAERGAGRPDGRARSGARGGPVTGLEEGAGCGTYTPAAA